MKLQVVLVSLVVLLLAFEPREVAADRRGGGKKKPLRKGLPPSPHCLMECNTDANCASTVTCMRDNCPKCEGINLPDLHVCLMQNRCAAKRRICAKKRECDQCLKGCKRTSSKCVRTNCATACTNLSTFFTEACKTCRVSQCGFSNVEFNFASLITEDGRLPEPPAGGE